MMKRVMTVQNRPPNFSGSVLPTEDKEVVFAERLADSYYKELAVIEEVMKTIRKNNIRREKGLPPIPVKRYLSNIEMLRMVHSFTIKSKDGGMNKDIGGELITLLNMYIDNNLEAGLDYTFLNYFKAQITQCFSEYLNSLSETMQTRLRSHAFD